MKVIFPTSLNILPAYPNFEPLHENTVIFLRAKKISIAVTWRTSGRYCHPPLASQPSTLQLNLQQSIVPCTHSRRTLEWIPRFSFVFPIRSFLFSKTLYHLLTYNALRRIGKITSKNVVWREYDILKTCTENVTWFRRSSKYDQ